MSSPGLECTATLKNPRGDARAPPEAPPPQPSSLAGKLCSKPLHAYIVGGESSDSIRKSLRHSTALLQTEGWAELPSAWTERRISVVDPATRAAGMTRTRYDKAFCVEWIDDDRLAVSTKCGHVLSVDRKQKTLKEVELAGERWVEPPIVSEDDLHRFRVDRGGIHCVRANASKNMLACSGGRTENHNTYVLNLRSEKWATIRRGVGHSDWVFSLSWVSDSTFITGSRDKTVKLWSPHLSSSYDMQPVATYNDVHSAKVRSILQPPGSRCRCQVQMSMDADCTTPFTYLLRLWSRQAGHILDSALTLSVFAGPLLGL